MEYQFKELFCEACGKKFIPAVEHVYKDIYKGHTIYYCGWNCTCPFRRKNKEIGKKRRCWD